MSMPPPSPPPNGRSPLGPWSGHQPGFRKPAPGKENVRPYRFGNATDAPFTFSMPRTTINTPPRTLRTRRGENMTPARSQSAAAPLPPLPRLPESFDFSFGRQQEELEDGEIREEGIGSSAVIETASAPAAGDSPEAMTEGTEESESDDEPAPPVSYAEFIRMGYYGPPTPSFPLDDDDVVGYEAYIIDGELFELIY